MSIPEPMLPGLFALSYLAAIAGLVALLLGRRSPQMLRIDAPRSVTAGPPTSAMALGVAAVVATLLFVLESRLLLSHGLGLPLICPDSAILLAHCEVSLAAGAFRIDPSAVLAGAVVLAAAGMVLLRRSVGFVFTLFALAVVAYAALLDVIAGETGPARPTVLLGGLVAVEVTAHGALLLRLWIGERGLGGLSWSLFLHGALALFRLLGALTMVALWPLLPPALGVAALIFVLLVPGLMAAVTLIAAPPPGRSAAVQPVRR